MTKALSTISLILVSIAVALSLTANTNSALFNSINHLFPSKALWLTLTNMGDVLFLGCVLYMLLRNKIRFLTNALICAALINFFVTWGKNIFAIARPEHTPDIYNLIKFGPAMATHNYAMPSGHTASAFMAATFVARAYNLTGWKLWAVFCYAILVGLSRIGVGAHWPADVCAGAAVGIIFALLCTHKKLNLTHISIQYVSLALYLPFMYFAIHHIKHIHKLTSFLTEGIIVAAGLVALLVWVLEVKRIFRKEIANAHSES